MNALKKPLVEFFLKIQHSKSKVEELQEYLESLLNGDEYAKGCQWEQKYGIFTLGDFEESFNWNHAIYLTVIEEIKIPNMFRMIPCESLEQARNLSKNNLKIPLPTTIDWECWIDDEQERIIENFIEETQVTIQVENLHLKHQKIYPTPI